MLKFLLNLLFPPRCINCRKEGGLLCSECYQQLIFCPYRLTLKPNFTVFVATHKSQLLKKILYRFKYNFKEEISELIADILFKTTLCFESDFKDIIYVPIPMHYFKKLKRGFNQTELIADYLAKKTENKTILLLRKTHSTAIQATLSKKERIINTKDAFTLNNTSIKSEILKKHIILIDDITTTGATLENAYETLKNHGFEKVSGLVLCHGL